MTQHVVPSIETHIPLTVAELPNEPAELAADRPDAPTPSLWQRSVKVKHKVTGKPAIVHKVDHGTMMFRAYYPDELNKDGGIGRFAERTEWEHCRDWDVEVTFSPRELERQAARAQLEAEISRLDAKELALVSVLCDDPDATKALAKLEAMRSAGLIKGAPEVVAVAVDEVKGKRGSK